MKMVESAEVIAAALADLACPAAEAGNDRLAALFAEASVTITRLERQIIALRLKVTSLENQTRSQNRHANSLVRRLDRERRTT